jgi:hypothetical protein
MASEPNHAIETSLNNGVNAEIIDEFTVVGSDDLAGGERETSNAVASHRAAKVVVASESEEDDNEEEEDVPERQDDDIAGYPDDTEVFDVYFDNGRSHITNLSGSRACTLQNLVLHLSEFATIWSSPETIVFKAEFHRSVRTRRLQPVNWP